MSDVEQIDAELSAFIVGDLADEYDPDTEARTLETIDEADRALWHLRQIETDMVRHERIFDARIKQMQERRAEVLGVMQRQHEWWSRRVEMWARAHAAETKSKTIKLPSGTVSFRQPSPSILPLAQPSDATPTEFVRVKRDWDKQAIKAATMPGPDADDVDAGDGMLAKFAITADGEIVGDLVYTIPSQPTITIKAGG